MQLIPWSYGGNGTCPTIRNVYCSISHLMWHSPITWMKRHAVISIWNCVAPSVMMFHAGISEAWLRVWGIWFRWTLFLVNLLQSKVGGVVRVGSNAHIILRDGTLPRLLQTGHRNLRISIYCQTYNIRCTSVGNIIVDHSDVVGASPVGAAPTTSSFST